MPYQQVVLELVRDGQCTPWGFRLTGGADIGAPLCIQKVIFGSPAEGELQKGDLIISIKGQNATRLSHQGATDLISRTGNSLQLIVARSMIPQSGSGSPVTFPDFSPFGSLPTSQGRQRRTSAESYSSTASSDVDNISNQPYRSIPLILPSAKTTKDLPTGSYLRFDPISKMTSSAPNTGQRFGEYYMVNRVQEALIGTAAMSSGTSSPGRTSTPDLPNGPQFLRQYNSPIHMYSNQAIVEALAAQTVGMKNPPIHLTADVLETNKLDIKRSPTYQMIHDEEWKKGPIVEHGPLAERVYNVQPGSRHQTDEIHQSGSFKSLMHNFKGISDF